MNPEHLRAVKDRIDQEQRAQQLLQAALESTMTNPHTVEQLFTFAVGYVPNDQGGVLSIAMPSGRRLDLMLDTGTRHAILAGMNNNGAEQLRNALEVPDD